MLCLLSCVVIWQVRGEWREPTAQAAGPSSHRGVHTTVRHTVDPGFLFLFLFHLRGVASCSLSCSLASGGRGGREPHPIETSGGRSQMPFASTCSAEEDRRNGE